MPQPRLLLRLIWLAFILCWLVLALFNKRTSRGTPPWAGARLRLIIVIAVLLLIRFRRHAVVNFFASIHRTLPFHPGIALQWLGVGLCLAGIGFAVWARLYIGRNWGMPMSLREGHELVTSGPYAYVRHPIYSGLMLAMIGSAFTLSLLWLIGLPLYFAYFIFAARSEEKTMLAQFPDAYPAYRSRTRMLIPFVF
jgi:protein-S-isoprenylcysteine O-methyltransferase Ste14